MVLAVTIASYSGLSVGTCYVNNCLQGSSMAAVHVCVHNTSITVLRLTQTTSLLLSNQVAFFTRH